MMKENLKCINNSTARRINDMSISMEQAAKLVEFLGAIMGKTAKSCSRI